MKIIQYLPGRNKVPMQSFPATQSWKALCDIIFSSASLDEAIRELQRLGNIDLDGEKDFKGVKFFLDEIKKTKEEIIRRYFLRDPEEQYPNIYEQRKIQELIESMWFGEKSSGTVKSGRPMNSESFNAVSRILDANKIRETSFQANGDEHGYFKKLRDLYSLERDLRRVYLGYDMESIDEYLLKEVLGGDALDRWHMIKNLPFKLLNENFAEKGPTGFSLTSYGLQKITWNILREVFKPSKKNFLPPKMNSFFNTEPYISQGTKPYQFGDHPQIDTSGTLFNALKRTGNKIPVIPLESDFEVYNKEPILNSATVVLLDLSKSMRFERRLTKAKKVTLALCGLVQKRYPKDRVGVVGFSTIPRKISKEEIPFLTFDSHNPYTNMEEAFYLGYKMLSSHKGFRRQVFLITDGEPTAHREGSAIFFQSPSHPATLQKTLQSADALKRQRINLSIFLLSNEKGNIQFMNEMARRASGNIFHLQPEDLGRCLFMDYLERKRKWI
jgi:uncharacterized protein with von Willebrand factor type A (vWA) domain